MTVELNIEWLVALILLTVRLGAVFFASPFDAMGRLPARIRVYMTLGLAFTLLMANQPPLAPLPATISGLVGAGVFELFLGLAMAFGFYCAFGSIMVAGRVLDFQAGFGAAQLLNPATNASNPLFGTVFSLLAVVLFFLSDAYLWAIKGFAFGLQMVPVGHATLQQMPWEILLAQFGINYSFGLILCAPVVAVLLLVDTGIAVMGRTMPAMNVYFLFLPLKIGIALALTAIATLHMGPVFEALFRGVFDFWQSLFVSMSARGAYGG